MKKIAVKMRKYINRVSVLVTVFAILMTASFYCPVSYASGSSLDVSSYQYTLAYNGNDFWRRQQSTSQTIFAVPSSVSVDTDNDNYSDVRASYLFNANFNLLLYSSDTDDPSFFPASGGKYCLNGRVQLKFNVNMSSFAYSVNQWQFNDVSVTGLDGSNLSAHVTYDDSKIVIVLYFQNYNIYSYDSNPLICDFNLQFRAFAFGGFTGASSVKSMECQLELTPYYQVDSWISSTISHGYSDSGILGIGDNVKSIESGYDASSGNASQSKLDTSLSQSEAKQDSLFTSASDTLSAFSLSDISTMPKVVAGLSFVSSTMTSIYNALGGINGAGIVLAVGCSILFVSLSVGAYKFYSSHKD